MKRHTLGTLPLLPLLLAAAFVPAAAQSPAPAEAPAGVSVLKYNWRNQTYPPGWDRTGVSADSPWVEDLRTLPPRDSAASRAPMPIGTGPVMPRAGSPTPRPSAGGRSRTSDISAPAPTGPRERREQYAYEVRIRNAAEATIEAVDWEYLFLDALTGGEMARHRFQSFRRAKPGKSLTLSGTSAAPPTRIVNAASARSGRGNLFDERIVVRCVAYSDGTVRWREGGGEADCADIKAAAARQASRR
jgi:hypothetical protein